jgi:hypothetical protein
LINLKNEDKNQSAENMIGLRKNINSEVRYNTKGVASSNFNPSLHLKTLNKGATTVLGGH